MFRRADADGTFCNADEVAYTATRADCLQRYREKKLRRLDVNTIRYMKRKINADRRPRASPPSPILLLLSAPPGLCHKTLRCNTLWCRTQQTLPVCATSRPGFTTSTQTLSKSC